MRLVALLSVGLLAGATGAVAQDRTQTLADIRQEMSVLGVQLQSLRRELSTTGSAMQPAAEGGPLERLDAIQGELRRLTAKTEELEFRINRIVEDGTNRLGDLQFRLLELEGGDLGQLGTTPPLGGEVSVPVSPIAPAPTDTVELAVGEQADFEAAIALAETGPPAEALAALDSFTQAYPRSPLSSEAHLYRGRMLSALGSSAQAGRAYLEAYTLAERDDPGIASEALFRLGEALGQLGQIDEACITLGQVGAQYPGTTAAQEATGALSGMTCQ